MPHSPLSRAAALALAAAGILAGCDRGTQREGGVVVDTLPGGVVHVRNTAPAGVGAIRATELARIGVVEGDDAYVFGRIHALRLGADGRVYVLDSQARELRIFDERGTHLRTVGGRGAGPGELQDVRGMAWTPTGTLWVLDFPGNRRFTEFSADGDLLATWPRTLPSYGFTWDGGFDENRSLYDPHYHSDPATGARLHVFIRHTLGEGALVPADTFPLPMWSGQPSFPVTGGNGLRQFVSIPFAPRLAWTFDGRDGFWTGTGESYRIHRQALSGDTVRVIELARAPDPVSEAERARGRAQIEDRLRALQAPAGGVDFSLIPTHHPAFIALAVDTDGRLWVTRAPRSDENGEPARQTTFDVFDPDGRHLGELTLDVLPYRSIAFAAGRVAGIASDEYDVESVVVYRLEW